MAHEHLPADPVQDARDWPKVTATIHPDGAGEITIAGTSYPLQTSGDIDTAWEQIAEQAALTADDLERPVKVMVTDPEGTWPVIVLLDEAGQPQLVKDDSATAAKPAKPRRRLRVNGDQVQLPLANTHGTPDSHRSVADDRPPQEAPPSGVSDFAQYPPPTETPAANGHQSSAADSPAGDLPTYASFLASRAAPPSAPATAGLRGALNRLSGGRLKLAPQAAELSRRDAVAAVQRSFAGPRTIMICGPKGGVGKTPTTLMLAAIFGSSRGGYTLAWDNNESRGSLGLRALPAAHSRTVVDLLHNLDQFTSRDEARVAELDAYVRAQGDAHFDVLASDEDPSASQIIDGDAFDALHTMLLRYYRILVVDTGNNERADNWQATLDAADQLVIPTTDRDDHHGIGLGMLERLRKNGYGHLAANAVTVLAANPNGSNNIERVRSDFQQATREVVTVPWDPSFEVDSMLLLDNISPATRQAWINVAAAVAKGL